MEQWPLLPEKPRSVTPKSNEIEISEKSQGCTSSSTKTSVPNTSVPEVLIYGYIDLVLLFVKCLIRSKKFPLACSYIHRNVMAYFKSQEAE